MNESLKDTLVHASRPVRFAAAAALSVLALFLLVKTFDAISRFGLADNAPVNTITVTGTGKASAAPTVAHVSFTVQETGAVVSEVQTRATKKTDTALAALKDLSIDEKDITTSGYSVSPQYETASCFGGMCPQTNAKIIGYQVTQSVEVKVRDVSKAGEVLGALGGAGVQNISGPNFTVDDDSAVKDEAREMAIKDAQAKAKTLAKQLHVDLGNVVSFAETSGGYPMPMYAKAGMAMMDSAAVSTPTIPAGTQETNTTVSITYEIR